ncbi:thioredoxin family protein [Myxococcota bacterium]|nr:thioredoxin family protein [Myxococcota bacterium]
MSPALRRLTLAGVGAAAIGVFVFRPAAEGTPPTEAATPITRAPRLVELGSTKCKSCVAMHEELGRLRSECPDGFAIEEIDVWRDADAARRHRVDLIPTQVFLDASGRELERHTGFLAAADIRSRFAAHGVACTP